MRVKSVLISLAVQFVFFLSSISYTTTLPMDADIDFDLRYKDAYTISAIFNPNEKIPVRNYVRELAKSDLSYSAIVEIKKRFEKMGPDIDEMLTRATLLFLFETAPVYPRQVDATLERFIIDAPSSAEGVSYNLAGQFRTLNKKRQVFVLPRSLMRFLSKDFHRDDLNNVADAVGNIENLRSQPDRLLQFVSTLMQSGRMQLLDGLLSSIAEHPSAITETETAFFEKFFKHSTKQFQLFFDLLKYHPELISRPGVVSHIFNIKFNQLKNPMVAHVIVDEPFEEKWFKNDPIRKQAYDKFVTILATRYPQYILAMEENRIDFSSRGKDLFKPYVDLAMRTIAGTPQQLLLTYQHAENRSGLASCEGFYKSGK